MSVCVVALAAALGFALSLGPARAGAHDSLAPAGAPHHWLAHEEWVTRHWVPFDEQTLKVALGLRGRELEGYLYNDHRSLEALVLARGTTLPALEQLLLQPWAGRVDAAQYAVLQDHTHRLLTQPHLAQHVFFHVFHGIRVRPHAASWFGVSSTYYWRLRLRGWSGRRIARFGGKRLARARAGMQRVFAADRDEGIRQQLALPVAAQLIERRRRARLDCWLARPLPTFDRLSFYGHQAEQHGHHHAPAYPATQAERAADDARVERFRRSRPGSCHPRPPPWPPPSR